MKKLYNKILVLILIITTSFTVTSCLEDNEVDYGKGPIIVRFSNSEVTQNFLKDGTGTIFEYKIPIEYKGANGLPLDEPITVTIGVNTEKSTAVEGKEFSLSKTEFTIPAGKTSDMVIIKVNSEELDASDPKTVVIDIKSASKTISDNPSTAITLQAVCPSNLAGDYEYSNGKSVTVTETGTGTYVVSRDAFFRSAYSFNMSDVCGKITVTGGFLEDNYGIEQTGTGSVDPETGNITIVYTAKGYINGETMVLIKK